MAGACDDSLCLPRRPILSVTIGRLMFRLWVSDNIASFSPFSCEMLLVTHLLCLLSNTPLSCGVILETQLCILLSNTLSSYCLATCLSVVWVLIHTLFFGLAHTCMLGNTAFSCGTKLATHPVVLLSAVSLLLLGNILCCPAWQQPPLLLWYDSCDTLSLPALFSCLYLSCVVRYLYYPLLS